MSIKTIKIHSYEKGFHFRNGELVGLLDEGRHWFLKPVSKDRVYVSNLRDPWIRHKDLDLIVKSGVLEGKAQVLDLQMGKAFKRILKSMVSKNASCRAPRRALRAFRTSSVHWSGWMAVLRLFCPAGSTRSGPLIVR